MEQQERPCHAALSTCMAQDEKATAAGCQKREGIACSKRAMFSTARGAGRPVLRLTAIKLVRGALLHHPRSVAGSKLAARIQE